MDKLPNIRHLAAFSATVEHGSVTAAATAVNLTQPALTQAIAHLERDLECQLFERGPAGMRPTEPAKLLHPRVEAALKKIGSSRVTATQLRAYLEVYRAGSYVAASARTGLAPASLHRAVADLSLALQERLIERRGRRLHFTKRGAMRGRNLALAVAELRSAYAEIAAWRGLTEGRIVIGAMPLSRARWLPRAAVRFQEQHGDVAISVIEGSHEELAPLLRDGDIDILLGALRGEKGVEDLAETAVFDDYPQVVMRHDHPLAGDAPPSLDDLRRFAWVLPSSATPLYGFFEELFRSDGGAVPHVAIECGSVHTTRELLSETDMLTLLSPHQVEMELRAGLLAMQAPPVPIVRTIGLTTRRDWRPTQQQRAMLTILHTSEH